MVKYYYDRYTTVANTYWVEGPWLNNGTLSLPFQGYAKGYLFDSINNAYTVDNGQGVWASDEIVNVGDSLYVKSGTSLFRYTATESKRAQHSIKINMFERRPANSTQQTDYSRGIYQTTVSAEVGTYPLNGRHTDGFWYVRGAIANNAPTLTVATTDNRTLYENDTFAVTGQVTDTDVGNVVITKFSINGGTERAITSTISQGTALTYNKVLTFKQGKLFDGNNAITDTLADGSQHVLRVWAEDDKGGRSAEQVRVFYVVANRSAVLTINPVTSKSDLIDSDTIAISGNVSDPDGNSVIVRYRIGNGLYSQIYSGNGGAFTFNVKLADLQSGVNTVTVQATDSYGLITNKTLRVTKSANNRPLLKSVATYKLTPPNGTADGIVLWIQRESGDLVVDAEISMVTNGAAENFVPMTKAATAYVSDTVEEDEFTFDNGADAQSIVVRLTMTRTSGTSDKGIKLISGVLS